MVLAFAHINGLEMFAVLAFTLHADVFDDCHALFIFRFINSQPPFNQAEQVEAAR